MMKLNLLKMIKIKAKFIGRNSLGYVHGVMYNIDVLNSGFTSGGSQGSSITICREKDSGGTCQYSRIETFLKNWELESCISASFSTTDVKGDSLLMGVLTSIIRESKIEKILK
jgi:hypothetical protein